jgi:hypothetical protein
MDDEIGADKAGRAGFYCLVRLVRRFSSVNQFWTMT